MRVVLAAFLTGVLWSGPALAQDSQRIRDWIEDLGRDKIEIRIAAEEKILQAGRSAWALLTESTDHPDPEIAARSAQILAHSRLRRQISFRILQHHPSAIYTLQDGSTDQKLRLIATFGRYYKESQRFLITLAANPNPQTAIAAAEALYDNRDFSWVDHLLEIHADETTPRSPKISRLLVAASSRIPAESLQKLLSTASLEGKSRLLALANTSDIPISISPGLLRELMRKGSRQARIEALRWIRNQSVIEEVPDILPLLSSFEPGVITEALLTLRILKFPVPVESMLPLLSHTKPEVRQEALRLLYFLDESTTAIVAEEKLSDPSTSVRKVALEFLWKIRGGIILPTVIRIYLEEGSEHADLAATYLIQNWDWAQSRLYHAIKTGGISVRHRAYRLLYRIGGNLILNRAMADSDEGIRLWALRRILSRNHPSTVSRLEKLTQDSSSHIRFEAIRGLVRRGQRERLDDLLPFLQDNDYLHQIEAAETLFDYSRDQVLSLGKQILKGTDPYLKRMALDALASRQVFGATSLALPCLRSNDPRLRRSAARYLSQALAHHPSEKIILALRNSLPQLKGERFTLTFQLLTAHGDESCRTVILEALRAGKGTNHYKALRSLCSWSGPSASIDLLKLLGDDPLLNRGIYRQLRLITPGEEALLARTMERLLKHRNHEVRSGAVTAAQDLTPNTLRNHLPGLLRDRAPEVRFESIVACRKLEKEKGSILLLPLLDDEDPELRLSAVENILLIAPKERDRIRKILATEECPWVRRKLETLLQQTNR